MAEITAQAVIVVEASRDRVWHALTEPDLIREYFMGATIATDWKVGSPVTYSGEWDGKPYVDKGEILEFEPEDHLAMSHWSPLSGTPEAPEHYHVVAIALRDEHGATAVTLTQSNLLGGVTEDDTASREDYERNWSAVLTALKHTVEARSPERPSS